MSNFPPPSYGGQYHPPSAHQPPYQSQNSPYQMNYQNQYLQHPSQQSNYQPPNTPQDARFLNAAAFNQNQGQAFYGHPQPPPSHPYYYQAHMPSYPGQSFPHGYLQPSQPAASAMNPLMDYSNSYNPGTPSGGMQNPAPFGAAPIVAGQQHATGAPVQPEGSYSMDQTDEIIQRALASTNSNAAKETSFDQFKDHPSYLSEAQTDVRHQRGTTVHKQSQSKLQDNRPAQNEVASSPYTPVEHISNLPGLPPITSSNIKDTDPSANSGEQVFSYGVWQEKRDAARKAVTEMLRAGVTLDQISQEGVDLVLLHQLFPELAPVKAMSKTTITSHGVSSLSPRRRGCSARSLESGEVSESDGHTVAVKTNGAAVPEETTSLNPDTAAVNHASAGNDHQMSKPGEERKDIIARLLAAKKTTVQERVQFSKRVDPSPSIRSSGPAGSSSDPTAKPASQQVKRPGGKDPVQTELVRKRIEALKAAKRPDAIQTAAVNVRSTEAMQPPEQYSGRKDLELGFHHDKPVPESAGLTSIPSAGARSSGFTPRSNSFYAEGDEQEFAGLPGLSPMLIKAPPFSEVPHQPREVDSAKVVETAIEGADDHLHGVLQNSSAQSPSLNPVQALQAVPSALSYNGGATPHTNRKRATASDFIDLDKPPSKKRAGHDHPIQLVIDVSEDEEGERTGTLAMASDPVTLDEHDAKSRTLDDRPPLSKVHSTESTSKATPLDTSKSLSAIEAEMKAMKEKIAARQKSRRALIAQEMESSRGASTGASNSGPASPHVGDPGSTITSGDEELKSKQQQRQRSLAASRTLLQEKLEAERRTHAMITAHAEQESRKAAQASGAIERGNRLDRKATLEAAIPRLQASIHDKIQLLENIKKQQDELVHDVERSQREHQTMLEELNVLLSSDVHMDTALDPHERKYEQTPPRDDPDVTDTHVRNTKVDLGLDNKSVADTSAELAGFSRHSQPSDSSHAETTGNNETAMDISGPSDDLQDQDREMSDADSLFESKPTDRRLHQIQTHDRLSSTGLSSREGTQHDGEDSYDISLDERFSDDDDDHEDLDAHGSQEAFPDTTNQSSESAASQESGGISEDLITHEAPLETHQMQPSGTRKPSVEEGSADLENATGNVEDSELSDDERSSSEEYEPPEVSLNVDTAPTMPTSISHGGLSGPRGKPGKLGDGGFDSIVGGGDPVPAEAPRAPAEAHFQPYESPLTRFTSYRFHPQYLTTVAGGFRSLTYSHQIRAKTPLCRWETAGGVCNDATCEYQHFRDLSLTDDAVLQQLSALHEGNTPVEEEQYKAGLRQILFEAHNGNIEDFDTTAAKVVAYRRQFLTNPAYVTALASSSQGAS